MQITSIPAHQNHRSEPPFADRHSSYPRPFDPVAEELFGTVSLATVVPEAALMCAVLEDAFLCFRKEIGIERRGGRTAQEAEKWFFSDDAHELFSFVSICSLLELNPESIRQRLKPWGQAAWTRRGKRCSLS